MLAKAGKIYVSEDVEIDTGRVVVRRAGEERNLRPKTFRLLLYLVEHRNRLVPKEELIARLWPDTAVSDGALAQCVADIRKALGEDSRNPRFIRTAARIGYQFIGYVEESTVQSVTVEETTEERLEYSEEIIEDETPALDAVPVALLPAPGRITVRRMALLFALAILAITFAFAAWKYWRPTVLPESEWWEVAWWKLNEGSGSAISDSIHRLTATLPAGVSWTSGISGSALFFTGRELVVHGNNPAMLLGGSSPRTLTAWIKTSATNGDSTPILGVGDATPDSGYGLVLDENGIPEFGAPVHFYLPGKQRIDDGRWHQLAGVFEGAATQRMRIFVDGVEQASTVHVPDRPIPGTLSQWTIGTGLHGGTTFRGTIDDARIYGRALRADEIRSLHRCIVGADDIDIDGESYYFAPVYGDHAEILPRRPGDGSAGVRNGGADFSGIMFVRREPDCPLSSIHGANIGQDLNIQVELLVPRGAAGALTDAGPYFRTRRANPGDGIVGGTSAGFWVRLDSTGQVRVQRLLPNAVLAFSSPPDGFNPSAFHKLETAVQGETLQVVLDGRPLTFDQGGVQRAVLQIQPVWETVSPKGNNGGSAGIAFSCTHNRYKAGGQEARNIRVTPYRSLATLPVTRIQSR